VQRQAQAHPPRHARHRGSQARTALWFDPRINGEGWVARSCPRPHAVFWYTYDENGEQAWALGVRATSGDHFSIPDFYRARGHALRTAFDPNAVQRVEWARVDMDFSGCNAASFAIIDAGRFGSGTLHPERVTRLAGTSCIDSAPRADPARRWSPARAMPTAQSEVATTTLGGFTYVAAGFGTRSVLSASTRRPALAHARERARTGATHPAAARVGE
jgi:hypothetical protein